MPGIKEKETWSNEIYQLEITDPVQGGENGIDNLPHKNLADRTQWLKEHKANKEGDETKTFKVKDATNSKEAINKGQLDTAFNNFQAIPRGVITMWSGSISTIPSGWFLCNGQNNTPDLRARFIYGASKDSDVGATGGSANAVVVEHNHSASSNTAGSHNHTANHDHTASSNTAGNHNHHTGYNGIESWQSRYGHQSLSEVFTVGAGASNFQSGHAPKTNTTGNHSHTIKVNTKNVTTSTAGSHAHGVTVNKSGVNGIGKNLPPYMKLAYIMKG